MSKCSAQLAQVKAVTERLFELEQHETLYPLEKYEKLLAALAADLHTAEIAYQACIK